MFRYIVNLCAYCHHWPLRLRRCRHWRRFLILTSTCHSETVDKAFLDCEEPASLKANSSSYIAQIWALLLYIVYFTDLYVLIRLGLGNCRFFFYGATAWYRALASLIRPLRFRLDSRFRDTYIFLRWEVVSLSPNPPTWRTRVSLLVWIIPFDLSGMSGPTSSYATAGIALRVIWPYEPHHHVKVEIPSGGTVG
jgi:hypothetical protein